MMSGEMNPARPPNSALTEQSSLSLRISRFFQLETHGTTPRREILGGVTTFLAMSYIIFVQPGVLTAALTYIFAALFILQFLIL
jgi:adenine/guanine/hypoxanthine permease